MIHCANLPARTRVKSSLPLNCKADEKADAYAIRGEMVSRRNLKSSSSGDQKRAAPEKDKKTASLERSVEMEMGKEGRSQPSKSSSSERCRDEHKDCAEIAQATRKAIRRSKSSDVGGSSGSSRRNDDRNVDYVSGASCQSTGGARREKQTRKRSEKSIVPPLTPSSKLKTGFEVDAPPRHNPRGGAAMAANRRKRGGVQPSLSASSPGESSVSCHQTSILAGLTEEQRAWAGIEALLLMGRKENVEGENEGDQSTVATRDVAALDIVRAAMASSESFSTQETTRFLGAGSEETPVADPKVKSVSSSSRQGVNDALTSEAVDASPAMPALADMSFSSLRSEATKHTIRTTVTQNYVVPYSSHAANSVLHRQYPLVRPSPADGRGTSMNSFMSQLCRQQERSHQKNERRFHQEMQPKTSELPPRQDGEDETTETEESIDLFADDYRGGEGQLEGGDEREETQEETEGEGEGLCSKEDEENDEDDENSYEDDHSRMLIQRYTGPLKARALEGRRGMPDLMEASFSSVRSEMSGIMSLISTAKNYVVQKHDVNPMGVFLGNITRNLERKQEAISLNVEEEARVRYMSSRDRIADERRKILEEEIERYQSGGYDAYNNDGCYYYDDYYDEGPPPATIHRPDDASQPSMPSAMSVEPTKSNDPSPLPSPYSDITPPFEGVRAVPAAADWRAWVDGAFKASTASSMPSTTPVAQGTAFSNPSWVSTRMPVEEGLVPSRKRVVKKKKIKQGPSQAGTQPSSGVLSRPRSKGKGPTGPVHLTAPPPQGKQPHQQRPPNPPLAAAADPKGPAHLPSSLATASALSSGTAPFPPPPHAPAEFSSQARPGPSHLSSTAPLTELPYEEVISLSRLRVPESSCRLSPSDLPRSLPSPSKGFSSNHMIRKKKKDKYDPSRASPLVSLRHKMAQLYRLGKDRGGGGGGGGGANGGRGIRRGSPASVLDFGGGSGGGIVAGRGDESRFFPTIDEEDEEDWSNQLLPCAASR
jgi:hypothetical protein